METTFKDLIKIIENDKVILRLEDRKRINANDYGFPKCHAEILDYSNPADKDFWDVIILGYPEMKEDFYTLFPKNKLMGVILLENGNHKLLFKVNYKKGFSHKRYFNDLAKFMKEYHRITNINLKYISAYKLKNILKNPTFSK